VQSYNNIPPTVREVVRRTEVAQNIVQRQPVVKWIIKCPVAQRTCQVLTGYPNITLFSSVANGVYYLQRKQKAVKRYAEYTAMQLRYGQCGHLLVSKGVYRDFIRT